MQTDTIVMCSMSHMQRFFRVCKFIECWLIGWNSVWQRLADRQTIYAHWCINNVDAVSLCEQWTLTNKTKPNEKKRKIVCNVQQWCACVCLMKPKTHQQFLDDSSSFSNNSSSNNKETQKPSRQNLRRPSRPTSSLSGFIFELPHTHSHSHIQFRLQPLCYFRIVCMHGDGLNFNWLTLFNNDISSNCRAMEFLPVCSALNMNSSPFFAGSTKHKVQK